MSRLAHKVLAGIPGKQCFCAIASSCLLSRSQTKRKSEGLFKLAECVPSEQILK